MQKYILLLFNRKSYCFFVSILDLSFYTFYKTLNIMLLPEEYITALQQSLGGTVCEKGSVGRERS